MSIELYLVYVAACIVLIIVPGPNVTLIIANSLRHGPRAGLLNVAGSALGIAVVVAILVAGFTTLVATMAWWFDWVRLAGAAYLIWLGVKLWRSSGDIAAEQVTPARNGFFWQGFLVFLSNPKALFFFGAFIPQFVTPSGNVTAQIVVLGLTFMVVAAVLDSLYALLAGGAGHLLSRARVRLLSRISGSFLIGGGIWLALARR